MVIGTQSLIGRSHLPIGCAKSILRFGCFAKYRKMMAEFLSEKAETCTPDTVRTLLATLKELQEGLYAMNWIRADIVPLEWQVQGRTPPRGPYALDEVSAIQQWVNVLS
jgi:hypothetical protein